MCCTPKKTLVGLESSVDGSNSSNEDELGRSRLAYNKVSKRPRGTINLISWKAE